MRLLVTELNKMIDALRADRDRWKARAERAEADADVGWEYARHTKECMDPFDYRCKCGYDREVAAHRAAVQQRGET